MATKRNANVENKRSFKLFLDYRMYNNVLVRAKCVLAYEFLFAPANQITRSINIVL